MTTTTDPRADWLAWRRKHLGASDVPALFLDNYYRGIGDVYLDKIGQLEDRPPSEPMLAGLMFEDPLIDWALANIDDAKGKPTRRNVRRVIDAPHKIHAATLDCQIGTDKEATPLQIKTTGLFGPVPNADMWGEPGTDEVPEHVILQVHAEMLVTGAARAYVCAWVGYRGTLLYEVQRDDALASLIHDEGVRFWTEYVEKQVWPEGRYTLPALKQVRKTAGKVAEVDARDLIEFERLREIRLEAQKAEDEAQAKVRAKMQDAAEAVGIDEEGHEWRVKITTVTQRRVSTSRLKDEYPDVAEAVTEESTYERFGVKKPKIIKVVK